ncbi:MAG TPA: selenocysteine-specific translation elongation factor [Anaerolineae bacterium]|jgi:selenocysteine-specific elongation factor|nr:selenocysteine-specific translation elongation factor [Anaerolineae bacterium]
MRVIGTAGHVDHGKSTLIAALTGTHPDRLKEEQEREMTIDLGFGWLSLPDGEEIGIVDVPGHRDFIENMLAGIGGIDAALLIIAADEGVMPQTREHLAILDLLQIQTGIIVITKVDLMDDAEWLDLLEEDVRRALAGTVLSQAPLVRVSARTGFGLEELLSTLKIILTERSQRLDLGRPRLPIDRVFSMPGFGTVLTGTLSDGHFSLGDEVELLPSGERGRIRGLQTHKKKEEIALPGSRTAVNVSGLPLEDVTRGEVLAKPGQYKSTRRIDARLRLLKDISAPLKHATEVKVFHGTTETIAHLRLLGAEALEPGEEGWIQLELRDPLVAVRGDRFIIRLPSPAETLGGGLVVDPQPKARHRRMDEAVLKRLSALLEGTPADVFFQAALALGAVPLKEMAARARLELAPAQEAIDELIADGRLLGLEEGKTVPDANTLFIAAPLWESLKAAALDALTGYHKSYPLRKGMPREELKSKLKQPPKVFNALVKKLALGTEVVEAGSWLARPGHEIRFSESQQAKVSALIRRFDGTPYSPPSVKETVADVGEDIYTALLDLGELYAVGQDVVFRKPVYEQMVEKVRALLAEKGQATGAEVRDLFDTSRKYALALLEHLDALGVTLRDGDYRRLRR